MMTDCIFCKIIRGEIPCRKIYEDEEVLAFHDIRPLAPVHFMLIPKAHVASLAEVEPAHAELLGKLMVMASRLAREQGLLDGYRVIVNTGQIGGQEVYHLHVHVLGGPDRLCAMMR